MVGVHSPWVEAYGADGTCVPKERCSSAVAWKQRTLGSSFSVQAARGCFSCPCQTLLQIVPAGQGVEGTEAMKLCLSKEQLRLYLDPLEAICKGYFFFLFLGGVSFKGAFHPICRNYHVES